MLPVLNILYFVLPDGANTPRQLSDLTGEITLSARYTPWGDALDTYGTGDFTFGYFGGVMDAATGLLYVGNGQYYDPATGRFLTRDAKPNNNNPYVPWDPTGAIIGPLAAVALFFGKRKRGSKIGTFFILLLEVGKSGNLEQHTMLAKYGQTCFLAGYMTNGEMIHLELLITSKTI